MTRIRVYQGIAWCSLIKVHIYIFLSLVLACFSGVLSQSCLSLEVPKNWNCSESSFMSPVNLIVQVTTVKHPYQGAIAKRMNEVKKLQ